MLPSNNSSGADVGGPGGPGGPWGPGSPGGPFHFTNCIDISYILSFLLDINEMTKKYAEKIFNSILKQTSGPTSPLIPRVPGGPIGPGPPMSPSFPEGPIGPGGP